jgi:hypothetical protein
MANDAYKPSLSQILHITQDSLPWLRLCNDGSSDFNSIFIPYQFLARPINNLSPHSVETLPQSVHLRPIRDVLSIRHPEVHDLDFNDLWRTISEAFDSSHNLWRKMADRRYIDWPIF